MELRPYQNKAKEKVFEQWDEGNNKTLLVLPTGCGKTIVFAKITEDCVRMGARVLILAHRGELLDQASDKIFKVTGLRCAIEKAEELAIDTKIDLDDQGSFTKVKQKQADISIKCSDKNMIQERSCVCLVKS